MITIPRNQLLPLLDRANDVAAKKATIPTLSCVRLTMGAGKLSAFATDLFVSTKSHAAAKGDDADFCVNASDILARIKFLDEGNVTLAPDDRRVVVKSEGKARNFTLPTMPGDDFPADSDTDEATPLAEMSGASLAHLFAGAVYAAGPDETRPHLHGALLQFDADLVTCVATDGHRLALRKAKVTAEAREETALVPLPGLELLQKMAEVAGNADIILARTASSLIATCGAAILSVKLVDAQFPPYSQVIPQPGVIRATLPRRAMIDAINAVAVVDAKDKVRLAATFDGKSVRLSAESHDGGDAADDMPCLLEGGKRLRWGANPRYLREALSCLSGEEVVAEFHGELDPLTIRENGTVAVVMPIRL